MSGGADMPDIGDILDIPFLRPVLQAMNDDGEETRIVGGAVRNHLMGRPIADIDLATTALPQVVAERAAAAGWKVVPTGIDHGTVTVVAGRTGIEITTLREDIETDGRRAVVRFGRDFEADAKRRDFTINALSVDIGGRLYDYCDGVRDIAERRVRFIGEPRQRIREDYLRILRFFRFQSVYGTGGPEREGLLASIAESHGLLRISAERIRSELLKLLPGSNAGAVIPAMADAGILTLVLGGACEFGRWGRLSTEAGPVPHLAVLAVMVREDADRLRDRLRLSNEEHRFLHDYAAVLERVKTALRLFECADIRRLVADWPPECVVAVFQATSGEPSPSIAMQALELLRDFASGNEPVPVFPLRGADFLSAGIPKGAAIGSLMAQARRCWMEMGCPEGGEIRRELLDCALASRPAD